MTFFVLIGLMAVLDAVLWRWGDRRLRPLRRAAWWRVLFALFMAFQAVTFLAVVGTRVIGMGVELPLPILTSAYVWHLFVLPVVAVTLLLGTLASAVGSLTGRLLRRPVLAATIADEPDLEEQATPQPTRRQMLLAAAVAVPPMLTGASVGQAFADQRSLRLRVFELPIAGLPPALDGLSIAHVSDIHTGRFTDEPRLQQIAREVNQLQPDLVLLTGDLIDFSLNDLPPALEMIRSLRSVHGCFACEGNHDLFHDRTAFEETTRASGVQLLLNEERTLRIRGQNVQILGLKWGARRRGRNPMLDEHLSAVLPLRRKDAFPILLAHHPHAFDQAAEAGIPLTLAGHTHGGQLMLTESLGPGPLLFRYWSGLYEKGKSKLIVSNGVGNWFPLRINAPAEIVQVVLRRE